MAVIGAYESTVTLRAILAADQRKVPLVNESASAASLTEKPRHRMLPGCGRPRHDPRPSRWFFRVAPNDRQAAGQFLDLFLAEHTPTDRPPKVAILHEGKDVYGNAAASATVKLADDRGMTTQEYKYPPAIGPHALLPCAKLGKIVDDIATFNPDVVIAASYRQRR